jgi:hypothetical protein
MVKGSLTPRALDRWDSSPFSSIFLTSSLYYSQAESTLAHLPVTQTVRRQNRVVSGTRNQYKVCIQMNYPVEVFIFSESRDAIIYGHVFKLFLAFVALGFSFYFSWRVRRKIDYGAERFAAIFAFCWALIWGTAWGFVLYKQIQNYTELQNIYNTASYSTAEGIIHVVNEQPSTGHARGDVIIVEDVEFEFNYFSESFGYHQTISHDGVLQEGVRVRLTYCERPAISGGEGTDNVILRVELLEIE